MAKGRPRKTPEPNTTSSPPRVEVLERRLQNPFGMPSSEVELKEPGWYTRWFNGEGPYDPIWRAKQNGYDFVDPAEVKDQNQLGTFSLSPEGRIVRGMRGQEVLMKTTLELAQKVARAKAEVNRRSMRPGPTKRAVQEAAGVALGSEAAEFIGKTRIVGEVRDDIERIERREEPQ